MCKLNKYLIQLFENGKYTCTLNTVFETKELAEDYINLYLKGRENCSFIISNASYFYNEITKN